MHLRCLDDLQSRIEWSCSFVFQPLSLLKCCNYGIGLSSVSCRGSWELRLTVHSFVAIGLFVGLIVFTPGTQLNIYVLLIPVISEH